MASRPSRRLDFSNIFWLFSSILLYLLFIFSYPRRLNDPSFSTQPIVVLGTLVVGLSVGAALAINISTRIHESLETNGEYKYTRKTVLYIILSVTFTLSILGYFSVTSLENGYLILNSCLISAVVMCVVELISDFFWEIRNKKIIMTQSPYRVYTVQK
jgi:hypothetical protein